MKAFHWRLAATVLPLGLAIAACADPSLTGRTGSVILAGRGTKANVVVTRPSTNDVFDGNVVERSGVTGVTITRPVATTNPTSPPVFRTVVTLTINGRSPGDWHDRRIYDNKIAYMVSREDLPSLVADVTNNSRLDFLTLDPGMFHFAYDDGNLFSTSVPDAQGYQRIDMLGFFVSNYVYFYNHSTPTASINVDLYWETMAEPCTWDIRATTTKLPGVFVTYSDQYKFRTKPYTGPFISALPADQQKCKYRFVVAGTPEGEVLWQSAWATPKPSGFVEVEWNGYSSIDSGPKDLPPEDSRNRLNAGQYFYCIEFYPEYGEPPKGLFRTVDTHGSNFVQNYYGASQWFPFQLRHGTKPSPSPGAGATPSPSPTPSAAPSAAPGATPTPDTVVF